LIILTSLQEISEFRRFNTHEDIEFLLEFNAVGIEREIIDVISEWVFELVSDGGKTHDDVGCGDRAGDGDPVEGEVELEGEEVNVEEDDFVADREGGCEDALGVCLGVGQGCEASYCISC
jgi:hypothetical protein